MLLQPPDNQSTKVKHSYRTLRLSFCADNAQHLRIGFWLRNGMMLRSAINITHIPEEQLGYRQCTRPFSLRRRPGYARLIG